VIVDHGGRSANVLQPDDTRAYALAELIPPTFQVTRTLSNAIGMYMETRKRFSSTRRQELASLLAVPLIRHMGLSPETSPDLLLCAVYVRTFLSEEHRSLANKQRAQSNLRTPLRPAPLNPPPQRTGPATIVQHEPAKVTEPIQVIASNDVNQ